MNLRMAYEIREIIFKIIKQYESVILAILKFLCFLIVFRWISGNEMFSGEGLFNSSMFHMALAIVAAILPNRAGVLLFLVIAGYNLVTTSLLGGALIVVFVLVLYIVTVRISPEYTFFMLLMPVCIMSRMYLLLPLVAGLYVGPIAIVPIITGTMLWGVWQMTPVFLNMQSGEMAMDQLPQFITSASEYGVEQLLKNESQAFLVLILAVVVLGTYLLTKFQKDYIHYLALAVSGVIGMVCLILCKMTTGLDAGYFSVFLGSIASVLIAAAINFMRLPLSYKAAQILSFSDDEYFYQVKVIPKVNVGKEKKEVKRITRAAREERPQPEMEELTRKGWKVTEEQSGKELSDTMRMNTETFFFNSDKE